MNQFEILREALWLHDKNPELKIHILACSDELLLGDFPWTAHVLSKVELGYWFDCGDGYIYTDPEQLMEDLNDRRTPEEKQLTEDEAIAMMERAILIHTRAG